LDNITGWFMSVRKRIGAGETVIIDKATILESLKKVDGPEGESNIVDLGLVSEIVIADSKVYFSITVPSNRAQELESLRIAAEQAVNALQGVEKTIVSLTAAKQASYTNGGGAPVRQTSARGQPGGQKAQKAGVPGIEAVIAVASGKGGVGKSTTSVNLALALQANGLKVGILDADIYGPSMPRLLGLSGKPQAVSGRVLKPLEGFGLKVMSMGFLVDEETPMIWRGPMVISALTQMLREVDWGELDVLVVDMPPGTGDAQLTMAQQVPLAGAVIVSTPQDLALIDARKGLNMFRRVEVPVLGIVENMSFFLCPHCGGQSDIFGHGGARREAEKIGVPFLGEVPLTLDIRIKSDEGAPIVVSDPDGPHARIYREIAERMWEQLQQERGMIRAPAIIFE
jgi:ATP-binding protein involved in chromosome partitioning